MNLVDCEELKVMRLTEEEKRKLREKMEEVNADKAEMTKESHRSPFRTVAIMIIVLLLIFCMYMKACKHIKQRLNQWSFCPYVYSYDGEQYRLDSETYAFAESKERERTAFDILDYLIPTDGAYKLMLANEHPETQYTNELKLLLVDHPRGTEVVPDLTGKIHTIRQPHLPIVCLENDGTDVLELVRNKDGVYWESRLFSKYFARDEHLRDGLILEFEKPEDARIAKIVVDGYNTSLVTFIWMDILQLQGEEVGGWCARISNDNTERTKMALVNLREFMLQVKIWENGEWRLRGAVPNPGPALSKEQIALLDVNNIQGDRLKVKLESMTGLWKIDDLLVDYSDDVEVRVTELSCESAVAQGNNDISATLERSDDSYYTTVKGDSATLIFSETPRSEGYDRTYILKIRGYYEPDTLEEGMARSELVDDLLTEPLSIARYYLPKWLGLDSDHSPGE